MVFHRSSLVLTRRRRTSGADDVEIGYRARGVDLGRDDEETKCVVRSKNIVIVVLHMRTVRVESRAGRRSNVEQDESTLQRRHERFQTLRLDESRSARRGFVGDHG